MFHVLPAFKALADETRLRLVHILWRFELNVNELVHIMGMGQSRISRHLKILSDAGLLVFRREGLWVFYSVPAKGTQRDFLQAVVPFWGEDPTLEADRSMAQTLLEERVNNTRQFFNAIAEDWDKLSREVLGGFQLAETVIRHLEPCAVAADFGCGTGNMIPALLEKAQTVIGVDGSLRMLELARRRFTAELDRISLRIGDLSHLPLRDGEADCACLNMVLHHLPTPLDALMEMRRVLRTGGTLVLTDFDRHEDETMRRDYGDRWLGFEAETLRQLFARAGFAVKAAELAPVERGLRLHIMVATAIAT